MTKSTIFILFATIVALASTSAFAHSGHGEWAVFAHGYEHMIWVLSAFTFAGVTIFGCRRISQRRAKLLSVKRSKNR